MELSKQNNEQGLGTLNELVKSPKQVKALIKKSTFSDSIVATPFRYSRENVEELIISNTSFCDEFSLISLNGNKIVVIENCIFHRGMQLSSIRNIKVTIRNCEFKDTLKVIDLQSGMLELYNTQHTHDVILCNIKVETLYTSNVDMKKENTLRLLNADVKNYLTL